MRMTQALATMKQGSSGVMMGTEVVGGGKELALPPLKQGSIVSEASPVNGIKQGLHRNEMNPNKIVGKPTLINTNPTVSPDFPRTNKLGDYMQPRNSNSLAEAGRGTIV